MNGNGNQDHAREDSPLEVVVQRLVEQQAAEAAASEEAPVESQDPRDHVHGWKHLPAGQAISLEQLHTGLLSVSQIAEAAIEIGVHITADVKLILPALQQVAEQLLAVSAELQTIRGTLVSNKRDIQSLKEDTRDMVETTRSIPGIKLMLTEVLVRLP
jgi:glycine cleavage system regulatory protein